MMKLFGRTSGYYLFWTGFLYFLVGLVCAFWYKEIPVHYVTMSWLVVLSLPLVVPQIGKYFNMRPLYGEDNMWRKREIEDAVSKDIENPNVVKFPAVRPELRAVEPDLDTSYSPYTIGTNSAGNVQFTVRHDYGSTTLTMTDEGVISLIEDLAHQIRKTHNIQITEK